MLGSSAAKMIADGALSQTSIAEDEALLAEPGKLNAKQRLAVQFRLALKQHLQQQQQQQQASNSE